MIIIQKEFQNLNHLLIITSGKTEFPAHSKDWRKFESNNKTIALNVLYVLYNKRQEANDDENENVYDGTKHMRPAYTSKYNNKRDIRFNLLMIVDENNN